MVHFAPFAVIKGVGIGPLKHAHFHGLERKLVRAALGQALALAMFMDRDGRLMTDHAARPR